MGMFQKAVACGLATSPLCEFERWAITHAISDTFVFGQGWWDYVDLVRRLSVKLGISDVLVIGEYVIDTPPPSERLPMPLVALETDSTLVALKRDFGVYCRWPCEWTLSVCKQAPYRGPILGLFDPAVDLRRERVDGLSPELLFGPYRENPAEFSCDLVDEWDVATFLRLMFYEA
jgi:hypothetical protein